MNVIKDNEDLLISFTQCLDTVMTQITEMTKTPSVYFKGGWELELRNRLCSDLGEHDIWCTTEESIYADRGQQVDLLINNTSAPHQYPIELKVQNMPSTTESAGAYATRHINYWLADVAKMRTLGGAYPLKLSVFLFTDRNFRDRVLANSSIEAMAPELLAGWDWWEAWIVKC